LGSIAPGLGGICLLLGLGGVARAGLTRREDAEGAKQVHRNADIPFLNRPTYRVDREIAKADQSIVSRGAGGGLPGVERGNKPRAVLPPS
jgi:hypothetical protein